MNSLKEIAIMASKCIGIAAYVFNIGGIAYLFYIEKPQFAVAALAVAGIAFPTIKKWIKELL